MAEGVVGVFKSSTEVGVETDDGADRTTLNGETEESDSFLECAPTQSCWVIPTWMWVSSGVVGVESAQLLRYGAKMSAVATLADRMEMASARGEFFEGVNLGLEAIQKATEAAAVKGLPNAAQQSALLQSEKLALDTILDFESEDQAKIVTRLEALPLDQKAIFYEQLGHAYFVAAQNDQNHAQKLHQKGQELFVKAGDFSRDDYLRIINTSPLNPKTANAAVVRAVAAYELGGSLRRGPMFLDEMRSNNEIIKIRAVRASLEAKRRAFLAAESPSDQRKGFSALVKAIKELKWYIEERSYSEGEIILQLKAGRLEEWRRVREYIIQTEKEARGERAEKEEREKTRAANRRVR